MQPGLARTVFRGLVLGIAATILGSCIFGTSSAVLEALAGALRGHETVPRALGGVPINIVAFSALGLVVAIVPGTSAGAVLSLVLRRRALRTLPSARTTDMIGLLGGFATGVITSGTLYLLLGPQPEIGELMIFRDEFLMLLFHPPVIAPLVGVLYARWFSDWLQRNTM